MKASRIQQLASMVTSRRSSQAEYDDCYGEVVVAMVKALHEFDRSRNDDVEGYVLWKGNCRAIDYGRSVARRNRIRAPMSVSSPDIMHMIELAETIEDMSAGLSEDHEKAAYMRHVDGLTGSEIADALRCSTTRANLLVREVHENARRRHSARD